MKHFVVRMNGDDAEPIFVDADIMIEGNRRLEFKLKGGEVVAFFDLETVACCYRVGIPKDEDVE